MIYDYETIVIVPNYKHSVVNFLKRKYRTSFSWPVIKIF